MRYYYKIFGLSVQSEIELDCYLNDTCDVDIKIKVGKVPNRLSQPSHNYQGILLNKEECLFYIQDVAKYYIRNGKEIIVEPINILNPKGIQLYLLGTSFGMLMMQRGEFPLHGSAVAYNNQAFILVGDSGAGKSSLASGFFDIGAKIITDDVSRLVKDNNQYYVHPSYPSQKIWQHTAKNLGIKTEENNRIINRFDKFTVDDQYRFINQFKPIKAVIEIVPKDESDVRLARLDNYQKLDTLIKHTYRYNLLSVAGYSTDHLRFLADLTQNITVYRIIRPIEEFTVQQQVNTILDKINVRRELIG